MKYFLTFFSVTLLLVPVFVFAQFKPLVGIPGVTNPEDFDQYLQAIYATAISLAALLAVIKIVIAGVKWMTTEIVTSKGDAKKDIEGAVFGLILILGAVLLLYIINPDIGRVDLTFNPAPKQAVSPGLILNADVKACNSDDTCKFETANCKNTSINTDNKGGLAKPIYDCAPTIAACLGKSTTASTDEDGNTSSIACLTTQADRDTALASIATANCPAGDTCAATQCDFGDMLDCNSACEDGGGTYYDEATRVCVTSPTQQLAGVNTQINNTLAAATLSGRVVSDATLISSFNSAAGATETYYVVELPSSGGGGNSMMGAADAQNSGVITAVNGLCGLASQAESIKAGAFGEGLGFSMTEIKIDGKAYAGCTR